MTQFYILVEAINIYENVFDTNQLSIIRGSSFLLKKAIDRIEKFFKEQLIPISTGASSGLFLVKDDLCADELTEKIIKELNNPDADYSLFTFIVEHCSAEDLLQAKNNLRAQLRISQMQSVSIAPDIRCENHDVLKHPDTLEGRRIAVKHRDVTIQKKKQNLSYSAFKRWTHGQEQKQNYLFQGNHIKNSAQQEKLKQLEDYNFSKDFQELSENHAYSKLNGKIAVIYMDGNSFSVKQQQILLKAKKNNEDLIKKQQDFDTDIQQIRSLFLLNVLSAMCDQSLDSQFNNALLENKKTIRFETLLWGGDEMLFVLPAWLGFEFLQYFFNQTKNWEIDGHNLTHAAGMVFCNASTPISNVRDLAQSLAETVKDVGENSALNGKSGRDQNAWSYMILESIDYPTNSNIEDFNKKHYGPHISKPLLIPAPTDWNIQKQELKKLFNQDLLSRRQLYRIVQLISSTTHLKEAAKLSWDELKKTGKEEGLNPQETQELRLLQVSENKAELLTAIETIAETLFSLNIKDSRQRVWLWIYLYELWDYVYPQLDSHKEKR